MNNRMPSQDSLALAQEQILTPRGLAVSDIERTLNQLYQPGIDLADIYFQHTKLESWILEDGIIKDGNYTIEQGVGVRAVSGEKTGFAYSDDIASPHLLAAAKTASSIVSQGQGHIVALKKSASIAPLYPSLDPLCSLSQEDKIDLLHRVDQTARAMDPRVEQVIVSLVAVHEAILVADIQGSMAGDIRPLVRMNVTVIAQQNGKREQGSCGGGARDGLAFLLDQERCYDYARNAVRQALVNLEAVPAPAGTMTVVLGPGWPGVLLHEAVGHGLEGDFNRKGTSAFAGRIGERVASPLCTIVDDGAMPGRRGSLTIDDEGTPTRQTVLIEKGILKGYMQDRLNARLMGNHSTGNGRRESYAHLPMPRMTNTYMMAGEHHPEEIIASVSHGLYAVNFGGGQVDITSGKFVFSANEAYLIENGRIGRPVKGATLIGNGPDVLTRVAMVGNDLSLDLGVGVCGKEGQSIPVGVGQPTLRVDELTVGGTHTD